jgi:hypothetical protein
MRESASAAGLEPGTSHRRPAAELDGDLSSSGASFLDRYVFHAGPVTVGDVLAAETRFQLAERGVAVIPRAALAQAIDGQVPQSPQAAGEIVARGKLDALALYLEIRRWEPDAPTQPAFVIVGASASLVDPASGKVVWR